MKNMLFCCPLAGLVPKLFEPQEQPKWLIFGDMCLPR